MSIFRRLIDVWRGRHRLESVELLPLGCRVADAIKLYGPPLETEPSEEAREITLLTFRVGSYHEAVVGEWQGTIQSITYWSELAAPARDLRLMLEHYQDDSTWNVLGEGYWYLREDGQVKLWCSAAPVIGVAYTEFLSAKSAYAKANSLAQLGEVPDITWAPDDAVEELQRLFVEEQDPRLMEFAGRSDRVAASPDGRHVFIVRNHHAYDVEEGFMELNAPPEEGNGYSTQVINCFRWDEDGASWGKTTLPRDAHVDSIRFDGARCHLQIRQQGTNRVLAFSGTPQSIAGLAAISIGASPYDDERLWQGLQEAADSWGGGEGRVD